MGKSATSDLTFAHSSLGKMLDMVETPQVISKLSDILSIMSKTDALLIFLSAKDGLASELDTPQKIGLTKKQYYTRLKQLVEYGLLNKSDNRYVHTALGSIVYNKHLVGLLESMKISKELEMIDLLKRSSKFKADEIAKFVSKLNPTINQHEKSASRHFEISSTYESMTRQVIEIIESAENDIMLATRFQNELIINAMLKKATRGVEIRVISDINMVEGYFKTENTRERSNDKNHRERINVVSNPFYPSKVSRKYAKVPYCMLIADKKHVGIEVIDNYEPNKFKLAFFGIDEAFSQDLVNEFEKIWDAATVSHPQVRRA
ncbi:MAG: hypothetical protein KGI33_02810 [Thaumarchaeota archaeon]|nr:hypothetical protein [Nitrososphaerota archaeon]